MSKKFTEVVKTNKEMYITFGMSAAFAMIISTAAVLECTGLKAALFSIGGIVLSAVANMTVYTLRKAFEKEDK